MTTLEQRLLILSCSRRKRPDPGLLPAVERYDGPMFRIWRKFAHECASEAQYLEVFSLSAEFGLIPGSKPIPDYNRRMTPHRAAELQPQVLAELGRVLKSGQYQELFISMGKDYLGTLAGYGPLIPSDLKVTFAEGRRGRQQAELYEWLRGGQSSQRATVAPRHKARIRGIDITLTPEQVLDVARRALAEGKGNPTSYQAWYVQVDDQQVSSKWLVAQLTGLPLSAFVTSQARRILTQLNVEVKRT